MSLKSRGISTGGVILMILGILLIIGFGYWGLRSLGVFGKKSNENGTSQKVSSKMDSKLVGQWDTGCLVPDPNSPWAERHTFTINADGTANHKRFTGETCPATKNDHDENYTLEFPASGQVNFIPTKNNIEPEAAIYDIYSVSGSNLTFGHGFCNCSTLCSASGGATAGDRFTCLNQFLVYKK